MTKKHFIALAEVLRDSRTRFVNDANWEVHCREIATICASSNRAFDRSNFLRACGVL